MGGNALKTAKTRRFQKDEYFALWETVRNKLTEAMPNTRFGLIESVRQKQDFGDMDVLIETASAPADWREVVIKTFLPKEVFGTVRGADPNDPYEVIPGLILNYQANSPTLSLDFQECQIDFIETPSYSCSMGYYSYNDTGNLMGRVAFSMGLRLTHYGLCMPVEIGTRSLGEIIVNDNFYDIIDFLGFDAKKHQSGFENLDEVFRFITANPAFDPWYFSFERRNSTDRIRDAKRPTYNAFLSWIVNHNIQAGPKAEKLWMGHSDRLVDREALWTSVRRQECLEKWPSAKAILAEKIENDRLNTIAKTKFNGEIVQAITGLTGKPLGQLCKHFKAGFESEVTMNRWLERATEEDIQMRIIDAHKTI